jgi:molybdenum cofactor biosynthesis protein B
MTPTDTPADTHLTRVAILTASDRCSKGLAQDTSGPALSTLAQERLGAIIVAQACLPDERDMIADQLRRWSLEAPLHFVILN